MLQGIKDESLLMEYANKNSIYELSAEDILKLMNIPYLGKEIAQAFGITEKEFKVIKKQKGIPNIILENIIRDIETILNYIDSKDRYVSNAIRNTIVKGLIYGFTVSLPKKEFYIKKLFEINFSREKVMSDLIDKNIDQKYRLNALSDILLEVDMSVEKLLKQEKDFLLNYNQHRLYNQMIEEKENGKKFNKEDLSYPILFELAIIENKADSLIASLFDLNKAQVKYTRQKMGLANKFFKKLETYPEAIVYFIEKKNERIPNVSNYEYEKIANDFIKELFEKRKIKNDVEENHRVTISVGKEKIQYRVVFSEEKYSAITSSERKSKGAYHNHKKENETKRVHGKIGEQLALEAEKVRLKKIGLGDLVKDVKLIAQVSEDITFDGVGYDLISFNEKQERVCIEVKTSFGKKDKPFFISKKELEIMQGIKEEYNCKDCLIYYVLVDGLDATIKVIYSNDFSNLKLIPVLYKVECI